MLVLSYLIYIFNIIPVKVSVIFFWIWKSKLKNVYIIAKEFEQPNNFEKEEQGLSMLIT